MQSTFKRGDSVRNTQTGDSGVVLHPPVYMENSRQWNVSVKVPGRKFSTLWYLPHVEEADPFTVVSAGDAVKIAGRRKGSEIVATVDYVSRNRTWMIVSYRGSDYVYKNAPIFGIMPASVVGGR